MIGLFPKWVQILVAVALAVFTVAEAVPMVLNAWNKYAAERAEYRTRRANNETGIDLNAYGGEPIPGYPKTAKKPTPEGKQ
jgi:hypothetical protein